jgi:hypothetical protein
MSAPEIDRLWLRGFVLSFAIVAPNCLISSLVPVTVFPYDDLIFFDAIWRVAEGQRDGIDFYNPMGFGLFHVGAWLWRLPISARAVVPLTGAVFSTVIVLCGSILGARRLAQTKATYLLISAVTAFIASAPTAYGWSIFAFSMSAFYNRLSVAALGVLFLQYFIAPRRLAAVSEAFIAAVMLNILLLTKISAFGLGLAIIASGLFLARTDGFRRWRHLATIALFVVGIALVLFLVMGVHPGALLADYRIAAHAREMLGSLDALSRIARSWGVLVTAILLALSAFTQIRAGIVGIRPVVALIATYLVIQLVLNITNTQPLTIYLAPFCAVALLAFLAEAQARAPADTKSPGRLVLVLICMLVLAPEVLGALVGAGLAGATRFGLLHPTILTAGNRLALPVKNFVDTAAPVERYADAINDGLRALQALGAAREKIASLDYANPFPVMLGAKPPKSVPVVWALGYMEPIDVTPTETQLFGDACIVMVPVRPVVVVEGSAGAVAAAAAPFLAQSFAIIRQDRDWKIYRRKSCPG